MALIKKILAFVTVFAVMLTFLPALETAALAESDGMIRVKLTRLGSPDTISFTTGCDYYVDADKNVRIPSGSKVTISVSGNSMLLNCGAYSLNMGSDFTINRRNAGITGVKFNSPALANVFCGDFRFMLDSGKITTIMTIYVEDYLYGVVGYEMSNSYPMNALKSQAVAARNYALRAKMTRSSRAYDVVDTSTDQVFRGYNSSHTRAIKAVDETRGMVLTYDGKLAACYYGSSNGGQTESTKNAWGSTVAYSVVKEDRFDLEGSGKCKSVTLNKDQTGETMNAQLHAALVAGMESQLVSHGLSTDPDDVYIETIVDIVPCDPRYPEPSILYKTLTFTVVASSVTADGERVSGTVTVDVPTYDGVEDWFGLGINSKDNETVIVTESDTAFRISFRRYGHGIGMSQHGARIMAMNYSMDYSTILDFYYPGTKLEHINLSDTTGSGLGQSGDSSQLERPMTPVAPDTDPDEEPVMKARVNLASGSGTLNMRGGPGTNFDVVTRLYHRTMVDVYAVDGEWVSIGYDGCRGYVMKQYLVKVEDDIPETQPEDTPDAQPDAEPETDDGEKPIMKARVKLSNSSSSLNIRRSATTSSAVAAKVRHGMIVDVYAIEGSWVRIGYGDAVGYVMKKYLVKEETEADTDVPDAAAPETSGPSTDEAGDRVYAEVKLSSSSSKLKLRQGPGTSYKVMGLLSHGQYVEVTALSGKWAKVVTSSGSEGYVHKDYLKRVYNVDMDAQPETDAAPADSIIAVAVMNTFVYSKTDTSSPAIAGLDIGDTVTVTAYNNTWARVLINGSEGYVPTGHLKRAK